jgi:hypothetical protein
MIWLFMIELGGFGKWIFFSYVSVCNGFLFILRGLGLGIPYVSPLTMSLFVPVSPNCFLANGGFGKRNNLIFISDKKYFEFQNIFYFHFGKYGIFGEVMCDFFHARVLISGMNLHIFSSCL